MPNIFPARIHLAVMQNEKIVLVWRNETRIQKWDIPQGVFFETPDERCVEMVLESFIPKVIIEKVAEIDMTPHREFQSSFVDGGIYRCTLLQGIKKPYPNHICITDGRDIPRDSLTDQAHAALLLCTQNHPV